MYFLSCIILQLSVYCNCQYYIQRNTSLVKRKDKKYQNIFLVSSMQPPGLKSFLPAPMLSKNTGTAILSLTERELTRNSCCCSKQGSEGISANEAMVCWF